MEEINAAGGIDGRRWSWCQRDDYADPDSAVFVATDLYEAGVSAVIGHLFSGTTLAAAPVYNGGPDPVAAISPSSSSPEVSTAGDYTFRICPSDLAHGAALAHWVRDTLGLQRGAVLYLNDQYGRGVRQTFVEDFTRRGGVLQSIDPYLGDVPHVGPYLDRLAKTGTRLPRRGGQSQRGRGDPPPGPQARPHHAGAGRRRTRRHRGGGCAGRRRLSLVGLSSRPSPTAANQSFVQAYRRKYPRRAGLPNQPAAATYDAVYLLRDVIARAGTKRQAVRRELARRRIRSPSIPRESPGSSRSTLSGRRPQSGGLYRLVRWRDRRPSRLAGGQ